VKINFTAYYTNQFYYPNILLENPILDVV